MAKNFHHPASAFDVRSEPETSVRTVRTLCGRRSVVALLDRPEGVQEPREGGRVAGLDPQPARPGEPAHEPLLRKEQALEPAHLRDVEGQAVVEGDDVGGVHDVGALDVDRVDRRFSSAAGIGNRD